MMDQIETRYYHKIRIDGVTLDCAFRFPETAACFGPYAAGYSEEQQGISVPELEWRHWLSEGGMQDAHAEYSCFTACTSDALLRQERMIVHGVSFSLGGKAWLICAHSGVGKSTQVRTLQELYPGQVSVICGDRTVLRLESDGSVIACPSPWNGKEGWHGDEAAPLAGILLLERSEESDLLKLKPVLAAVPFLPSVICTYKEEETVHLMAAFVRELLNRVPVWRYRNGGVPESSRMLYEQLLSREAKE